MFKGSKLKRLSLYAATFATAAVLLTGCGGGSDGAAGVAGTPGTNGTNGTDGTNTAATVQVSTLSAAQWGALKPQIDPASISVTISSAPVVKFKVTDGNGNGVVGLTAKSQAASATVASYNNIGFTLAKLVPGTPSLQPGAAGPSKWVSYMVTKPATTTSPAGGTYPTFDKEGTLVDNGDGTYQYTFYRDVTKVKDVVASLADDATHLKADLGDLTYDATLTHRLGIMIYGNQPGTGTNTSNAVQVTAAVPMINTLNAYLDFRPDGQPVTASRTVVTKDSCSTCHDARAIGHISVVDGNYIGRNDPNFCVTCHTDQTKYGFTEVTTDSTGMVYTSAYKRVNGQSAFDYPRMIHQTHMGKELTKTGYNLNGHYNATTGANPAQAYNKVGFPQDIRNCTTCHDGSATATYKTPQGDNWQSVPSILACGACHDGINFATGTGTTAAGATTGHVGGAQDDTKCAICHTPAAIVEYHKTTVASTHNPVVQADVASFTYKISGVTINASNQVVVKFQVLKDGTAVAFNAYAAGANLIDGFTGGPSFGVAYATGQDGIAAPSDWNSGHDALSLTDAWAGVNGNTLSGPDASNTYTVTIVQSSLGAHSTVHSLALPTDAKMVTALMKDSFTQTVAGALTNVAVPGIPAMMAATGNTPDGKPNVARRVVFSEAKCNSCHDRLGTSPNFHGGNYSIAMCAACHTPNQGGSTGWSASFRVWVHGIHSASKRTVPFTWHAVSATNTYQDLLYPGKLKDCEQCHLPGTYDFSASQYTPALIGSMLDVQAATGKLNPASATNYVFPQAAPVGSGKYAYGLTVDNTYDYGAGNSIDPATGALVAQTTQANNLVSSPITAVCSTCHDSTVGIAHMQANGGSFYAPRASAVATTEQCLVCHGSGKVADIKTVHGN